MWVIEKIEISGGFLPGLSVNIPPGLTCIIGARGSGKSKLAEAVRFALCGLSAAPKSESNNKLDICLRRAYSKVDDQVHARAVCFGSGKAMAEGVPHLE